MYFYTISIIYCFLVLVYIKLLFLLVLYLANSKFFSLICGELPNLYYYYAGLYRGCIKACLETKSFSLSWKIVAWLV
jgi:hypothetical protein